MLTIYTAPSDREYYDQLAQPPEPAPGCDICGATDEQAHEEWCGSDRTQARLTLASEKPALEGAEEVCPNRKEAA